MRNAWKTLGRKCHVSALPVVNENDNVADIIGFNKAFLLTCVQMIQLRFAGLGLIFFLYSFSSFRIISVYLSIYIYFF